MRGWSNLPPSAAARSAKSAKSVPRFFPWPPQNCPPPTTRLFCSGNGFLRQRSYNLRKPSKAGLSCLNLHRAHARYSMCRPNPDSTAR